MNLLNIYSSSSVNWVLFFIIIHAFIELCQAQALVWVRGKQLYYQCAEYDRDYHIIYRSFPHSFFITQGIFIFQTTWQSLTL